MSNQSSAFTVKWRTTKVVEKLENLAWTFRKEAIEALIKEGSYQLDLAMDRTPIGETGQLLQSQKLDGAVIHGDDIKVSYGFGGTGGSELPYAMKQHWSKHLTHDIGEARWGYNTLRRERTRMGFRMLARIQKVIRRGY